jgi:putative ABC transport system ATP-binding protein
MPKPTPTQSHADSDEAVRLDAVTKVYAMGQTQVHALDGVSLSIAHGAFAAVMGASGSGKSTMLNVLGCLDRPTSGQCLIGGQAVASLNDNQLSDLRLRRLGFIFQSFNLIAQLTVRENIELPLFYLGWEARQSAERAAALAERVGLEQRLDHRPAELSGGQQQRVAIARALANDPAILLADEPTGNLDSSTGEQILQLLETLNSQGRTVIMVTHEPDVAERAAHQVHMLDGRIERVEGEGSHVTAWAAAPAATQEA